MILISQDSEDFAFIADDVLGIFDILPKDLQNVPENLYRNNLKNREFGKEDPQNFDSERAIIAERQGASENQNSEVNPTQPKPDSSCYFGIIKGIITIDERPVAILEEELLFYTLSRETNAE
jgi:hypothetical protein